MKLFICLLWISLFSAPLFAQGTGGYPPINVRKYAVDPSPCQSSYIWYNTTSNTYKICPSGVATAIASGASITATQGYPLSGTSSNSLVSSALSLDATMFCGGGYNVSTKKCNAGTTADAITAAIGSVLNLSNVIDARGFSGVQYLPATANMMLFGGAAAYSAVPVTILWGTTTFVIDGPANGLYYTDGGSSTYGTPAMMIPSQLDFEGLNYNDTIFTVCTGSGTPIASCTHAFPQRSLGTVTSTSLTGNVLTVNTTGVTLTANTNVWVGERVQLVGLGTANNNVTRVIQSVPTTSSFTINMPTTTTNCAATCGGTAYAFTPVLGFAPGPSGGPYIPLQSGPGIQGFGQKIRHVSLNLQGNQADASLFTGYGVSGIQNVNGGDQSGIEDVEIHFNTGISYDLGPGSTDAYYKNIRQTNLADNHAVPSSLGIFHAAADRGIDGWAIIGSATQTPIACMMVDGINGAFVGTTDIKDGHAESCVHAIEIGANTAARSIKIDTFLGCPSGAHSCTDVIHLLSSGTNCQGCNFLNITRQSSGSTNTVVNDIDSTTITDLALGQYQTDVNGVCSFTNAVSLTGTCQGLQANGSILKYGGVAVPTIAGDLGGTTASPTVTGGSHITNASIPNSGLVNAATTVNGQTCTLGSPCTITLSAENAQTATYPVVLGDFSNYKTILVASGTFTITLVASGTPPPAGQYIKIINYGSGIVTVARNGQNINGAAANLTLAASSAAAPSSVYIESDGTNYFADSHSLNATSLIGKTWAAPANIGTGTPATAAFSALSATGVIVGGNTVRLTADSSAITATTPGTTFLTLGTLTASTNYSFNCELLYSQATAVVLDGLSVQAATNAATRWDAWGTMNTVDPITGTITGSQGSALNVTTTTSTPIVTATPGAIGTVYQARLSGSIQVGASVPTVNIAAFTGNASDAVTIKAGSFCAVTP